ncbi:SAM-dependent methyltransferase [Actinoplanes campanulatus]|uniref:SAM-dependent methyltransferase n=1 Tax=Actinoplanes campanulatus TaxID=113559 RepID=A0A7W5ASG9_9ACTN|nr:methyltransferase [Actinoplanes campanulatus]MBB3101044.1 SAM-dependent methyltransferase [Actinoplanes campanulatus]GGN49369.1 O-methyltransferase [Actinoplanes campanulatus]GID41864.1 O-methyltransferase [Actinoplanes campanulatus]
MGFIIGPWLAQAVRSAVDLSLAEHLADGPRSAAEIAAAEGADPQATARFLRACASIGLVAYADGGFAGTDLLAVLHRDAPMSLRDLAASQSSPCLWRTWARIPEAVRSGESQTTQALGMSFFDYLAAHPDEGRLFGAAMASMSAPVIRDAVEVIDVAGVTTVVDVGGAHGSFALALLEKHPGLDAIVLDLAHAVPGAQAAAVERGLDDRFTAVAGDFFKEVPTGDLLLLKFILHDWSDDECVRILANCRDALHPGGRIVITEILISDDAAGIAPLMDIAMLATVGSRERTLAEFDDLLTRAGLHRVAATPVEPPYAVIEATVAG